jgi:hypothetical protein
MERRNRRDRALIRADKPRVFDTDRLEKSFRPTGRLDRFQNYRLAFPADRNGVAVETKLLRKPHGLNAANLHDFSSLHVFPQQ